MWSFSPSLKPKVKAPENRPFAQNGEDSLPFPPFFSSAGVGPQIISSFRRIPCSNHTFSRPKHLRTSVTCWQCKHVLAAFESKRTELSFCLGWSCHSVLSKRRVVGTAPMCWGKHGPFTNDYLLGAVPSILTWRVHKTSSHQTHPFEVLLVRCFGVASGFSCYPQP